MIRPRPLSQLSGRARGLRPVPPTGRTTARFTRPLEAMPGHVTTQERAARRARGKASSIARRRPTTGATAASRRHHRAQGAKAHTGRRVGRLR